MRSNMKLLLLIVTFIVTTQACHVCDLRDKAKVDVKSTFAIAKIQRKLYGQYSEEYKKAKKANEKAWDVLRKAEALPVSHKFQIP